MKHHIFKAGVGALLALLFSLSAFAGTSIDVRNADGTIEPLKGASGQPTITLLACEDQTNSVCRVETQTSGTPCAAAIADTQCKATAGFVNTVTFSQTSLTPPVAGVITIYDSATEAGTVIWSGYFSTAVLTPFTILLNRVAATGIFVGYDATVTGIKMSVSYR